MENESNDRVEEVQRVLGNRVRGLRSIKGLTQVELAEALETYGLKFKQATIAKLEGGKRPTTVAELTALAQFFGQEPADLLVDHEMPEGLVDYAEAEREEKAAGRELRAAVSAYLTAQERVAKAAEAIKEAGVVDSLYIARGLAMTPEYIVRDERMKWRSFGKLVEEWVSDWSLDGKEISAEANSALKAFAEKPLEDRSFVELLGELNGLDPEAS